MYTGTRPGGSPAIRAGRGWWGRRELAPRCSATQLGACSCGVMIRHIVVIPSSEPQPPQPPHKAQTGCSVCVGDFCCAFKLSTMDGVGNTTGAAMRRRQRRLRSWLRHERMTVAMILQKSCTTPQEVRRLPGSGRRWCTTRTTPCGDRRHHLWGCGRAVSLSPGRRGATAACGAPQGKSSPGCHRWRMLRLKPSEALPPPEDLGAEEEEEEQRKKVVAKQREEKHVAKMKLLNDKVRHDMPLTEAEWAAWRQWMGIVPSSSSSAGRRRKRKKRRKKRLPKSSSSRSARTWYSGQSSTSPCLPVHARCLRALWIPAHTSVMEAFWKISSVFVVPGGVQYMLCVSLRNSSCTWVRILRSIHLLSLVFSTLLILFHGPLYLAATGSVFGGGVQDHIQRFLVRQRIHLRRQSTLCSKTSFMAQTVPKTVEFFDKVICPLCKDRFYGADSAGNC